MMVTNGLHQRRGKLPCGEQRCAYDAMVHLEALVFLLDDGWRAGQRVPGVWAVAIKHARHEGHRVIMQQTGEKGRQHVFARETAGHQFTITRHVLDMRPPVGLAPALAQAGLERRDDHHVVKLLHPHPQQRFLDGINLEPAAEPRRVRDIDDALAHWGIVADDRHDVLKRAVPGRHFRIEQRNDRGALEDADALDELLRRLQLVIDMGARSTHASSPFLGRADAPLPLAVLVEWNGRVTRASKPPSGALINSMLCAAP